MSYNNNHIINRSNYEEFFILYMDKELSAEQEAMVEDFLAAHPDLQEEMDILLSTQLPAEEITFGVKDDLLAHQMQMEAAGDSLLLYIDNELTGTDKKKIEDKIHTNSIYNTEFKLLSKTKLDSTEVISYPNKKELYRHTGSIVSFRVYYNVAAAIILIVFASIFFISSPESTYVPNVIATAKPNTVTPVTRTPVEQTMQADVKEETPAITTTLKAKDHVTERKIPAIYTSSVYVEEKAPVIENKKIEITAIPTSTHNAIALQTDLNNINSTSPVTTEIPGTYNTTEDPSISIVTGGEETKIRKGSLKGFLRKATRLIERNTGIGTANDDNELLIGAIALKLK